MTGEDNLLTLWRCGCFLIMFNLFLNPVLQTVQADLEHHCDSDTYMRGSHPDGLCGPSLSDMISLICGGLNNINTIGSGDKMLKRNEIYHANSHGFLPRVTKQRANSYLKEKRSGAFDNGVSCECCYHSCSFYELAQYCINPPVLTEKDMLIF